MSENNENEVRLEIDTDKLVIREDQVGEVLISDGLWEIDDFDETPFLIRHLYGDWDEYGHYDESTIESRDDPDAVLSMSFNVYTMINKESIKQGQGAVISLYNSKWGDIEIETNLGEYTSVRLSSETE